MLFRSIVCVLCVVPLSYTDAQCVGNSCALRVSPKQVVVQRSNVNNVIVKSAPVVQSSSFVHSSPAVASSSCVQCAPVVSSKVVSQSFVDYVPTQISFVPSQVVLGGQYTVYDPGAYSNSGIGYSYQGPPAPMAQQNVAATSGSEDLTTRVDKLSDRLDRIEDNLVVLTEIMRDSIQVSPKVEQESESDVDEEPTYDPQPGFKKLEKMLMDRKVSTTTGSGWKQILVDNCVRCHGATSPNGAFVDADGEVLDTLPRNDIYARITLPESDDMHMPKGGPSLSDSDIEKILDWANMGLEGLNY